MLMKPPTVPANHANAPSYADLVNTLEQIRHATAPTPDDGGHHEAGAEVNTQTTCAVCGKDPTRRNNEIFECAHVDCPHRRHAWSERPTREQLYKGPWPKNEDKDPKPLA